MSLFINLFFFPFSPRQRLAGLVVYSPSGAGGHAGKIPVQAQQRKKRSSGLNIFSPLNWFEPSTFRLTAERGKLLP